MSEIPKSIFKRGSKLVGLATKIALNEVGDQLKRWENPESKLQKKVKLAQDMVKLLSELKGASMKFGQLLSLDLGDYIPPEILKVLDKLHQNAPFLAGDVIHKIIKQELGPRFHELKNISTSPIAAASIGQVHTAEFNGEKVVIKVQYPGVADSIPSDLKILRAIMKQGALLTGKDVDFEEFFSEVEEVLKKEVDYKNELTLQTLYRDSFSGTGFIIPKPFPEFSTDKILTQSFIDGVSIAQWIEKNPPLELREKIADKLIKLYLMEIFKFGLVQTDPNPGNFLITPDHEIALLDFGATKAYSKEFVCNYFQILNSTINFNREDLIQKSIDFGLIDRRESKEVFDLYIELMEMSALPFESNKPFDFKDQSYQKRSTELSWALIKKYRYTPPPKDLIFLHRKLGGIFGILKRFDISISLAPYWVFAQSLMENNERI